MTHAERELCKTKINELIRFGIIRESDFEYAGPVKFVRKANGKPRMCIDYRKLNQITKVCQTSIIEDQPLFASGKFKF